MKGPPPESPASAWKEVQAHWRDLAVPEAYIAVECELSVRKWVDLTDPAEQTKYGITSEDLIDPDWRKCQALSHRLRSRGIEAVRTFLRANQPDGRVCVVFLECLEPKSRLDIQSRGPVPATPPVDPPLSPAPEEAARPV